MKIYVIEAREFPDDEWFKTKEGFFLHKITAEDEVNFLNEVDLDFEYRFVEVEVDEHLRS